MAKQFRLRISKIIPCASNNNNNNTVSPGAKTGLATSIKRHVSSALGSCGWTVRSKPVISSDDELGRSESPNPTDHFYQWETEEQFWKVVEITETPRRKIYNSSADENDDQFDVVLPPTPTTKRRAKQWKRKSHRASSTRIGLGVGPFRLSTSSAESGLFTSETFDADESETLVSSSRSLSNDESYKRQRRRRRRTKTTAKRRVSTSEESAATPARLSVFHRVVPCTVRGKVRESFAIVKRSDDPYEDFKRSMAEMILEKQMFDDEDLEQLLHCFLSLNSRSHHGDIVRAFIEIWESLFSVHTGSVN